jgi:hypothetical protein
MGHRIEWGENHQEEANRKGEKNMKTKFIYPAAMAMFLFMSLVFSLSPTAAGEGPAITESFAAKEIIPGDTWKIYINASDPDAKMKYVFASVQQAGGMAYPLSITRIREKDQERMSGFVYVNTVSAGRGMDYATLSLTLQVRDEKGRFSEPREFPLTFKPRIEPENPPAGIFAEKDLGPIMIRLRPVADDGGGGGASGFGF